MRTVRFMVGRGSSDRPQILSVLRWWFRVPVRGRERTLAPVLISLLGLTAAVVAARVTQTPAGPPPAAAPLAVITDNVGPDALPLPNDLPVRPPTGVATSPVTPNVTVPVVPSGRPSTSSPALTSPPTGSPGASPAAPSPPARSTTPVSPSRTTTAPACRVGYVFNSTWGDGFVATITLTNVSGATWSGWSAGFGMSTAATIQNSWNAGLKASGGWVLVTPASYNTSVPDGGRVEFGFQAGTTAPVTRLGPFVVNGRPCS